MNKKQVIIILIILILAVGVFFFLRKNNSEKVEVNLYDKQVVIPLAEKSAMPSAVVSYYEIIIKDKKLAQGEEVIKVSEGDDVLLKIISDENEEFHLHGYDKVLELKKNTPVELKFKADIAGRFVYELENSKTDIGAIEVLPK